MINRNAIAKWRKIRGKTQKELAEYLGINRALLSQIETGLVAPTEELLIKISRYLNCLITDLYSEEEINSIKGIRN